MSKTASLIFFAVAATVEPHLFAQTGCAGAKDAPLAGVVHDSTHALVAGATVTLDGGQSVVSAADGQFRFACVAPGHHALAVRAAGFPKRRSP